MRKESLWKTLSSIKTTVVYFSLPVPHFTRLKDAPIRPFHSPLWRKYDFSGTFLWSIEIIFSGRKTEDLQDSAEGGERILGAAESF
jgi:hypothetical protein